METVTSRVSPVSQSTSARSPCSCGDGLAQVVDLEHERLELVVAERVDALLEALRIVEVADHDREAAPLVLRDEVLHALGDAAVWPPMSHFCRKSNTRKMRFLPRDGGRRSMSRSPNGMIDDAIEVREADVRQRGADLHRVVQLRQRRADRHRVRDVDQDVDVEVFFFLEQAQQQLVEAAVEVPVDVAEVVAARVRAVIGELDARADFARAALGAQVSREHLARHHVQVLERLQEPLVEQLARSSARFARGLAALRRRAACASDATTRLPSSP